jgi:hypothetical protein
MVSAWCYRSVTAVLQRCYSGVTLALKWCFSGVTAIIQWCCSDVPCVVLQWCYSGVTCALHGACLGGYSAHANLNVWIFPTHTVFKKGVKIRRVFRGCKKVLNGCKTCVCVCVCV